MTIKRIAEEPPVPPSGERNVPERTTDGISLSADVRILKNIM
jgi:hypothetical protein